MLPMLHKAEMKTRPNADCAAPKTRTTNKKTTKIHMFWLVKCVIEKPELSNNIEREHLKSSPTPKAQPKVLMLWLLTGCLGGTRDSAKSAI